MSVLLGGMGELSVWPLAFGRCLGLVMSGPFWGASGVVGWLGGRIWWRVLGAFTVVSQLARTSELLRRGVRVART
jgi:hypothetical protein